MNEPYPQTVGWREWVALPDLGIPAIKAKFDTGARTSALHTFRIETFADGAGRFVRFALHPRRSRPSLVVECVAPILDRRVVRDSGGHLEERLVICSTLNLGGRDWPIEITLANREDMRFKLLVGRAALVDAGVVVDPARSFVCGKTRFAACRPRRNRGGHP